MNPTPTEIFIQRAKKIHGNQYDYSKTIYINTRSTIIITCPIHGDFEQKTNNHLNGTGCRACFFGKRKFTTDVFVEKALKIHNGKYDYSKVVYIDSQVKVLISCPIHGDFEQKPNSHLSGHGCPNCRNNSISINSKSTKDEFIIKAKNIHGDKYDYSQVEYINSVTKVKIICPEHDVFEQSPGAHVFGKGCPNCYGNVKYTTDQYIEKCKTVHNNRYDYSKVVYTGNKHKVLVNCPDHGEFYQLAQDHLRGTGCFRCKESKGERFIADVLDKHHIKYVREYKLPLYAFKYDFYLPDENIFIEFHGSQHFFAVDYFGGNEGLKKTQFRDAFKRNLAREYKIPLLEFNYRHIATLSDEEFENAILKQMNRQKKLRRT